MKTYKLFLIYPNSTKVKQYTFGKCREGLDAAHSYAESAAAFAGAVPTMGRPAPAGGQCNVTENLARCR